MQVFIDKIILKIYLITENIALNLRTYENKKKNKVKNK